MVKLGAKEYQAGGPAWFDSPCGYSFFTLFFLSKILFVEYSPVGVRIEHVKTRGFLSRIATLSTIYAVKKETAYSISGWL